MTLRKPTAWLFAAAAIATSVLGLDGTAAAHTDSELRHTGTLTSERFRQPPLTAAQMRNAVTPEATRPTSVAPDRNDVYWTPVRYVIAC